MIIHDNWLFVSTMKCATNTLYRALPTIGGKRAGVGFHGRPDGRERDMQWTVIRDPYDRAVSIWASTCRRDGDRYRARARIKSMGGNPESFADFAFYCLRGDDRWAGGHKWLFRNQVSWHGGMLLDRFARFEHLEEDVTEITGHPLNLTVENPSRHDDWRECYDQVSLEIVTEWAGDDVYLCPGYALVSEADSAPAEIDEGEY